MATHYDNWPKTAEEQIEFRLNAASTVAPALDAAGRAADLVAEALTAFTCGERTLGAASISRWSRIEDSLRHQRMVVARKELQAAADRLRDAMESLKDLKGR